MMFTRQAAAVCALVAVVLLAAPTWAQTRAFRSVDERSGGEIQGFVTVTLPPAGLTPSARQAFGNSATVYMSGHGTTGTDGSVGAKFAIAGLTCSTLQFVVATPVYVAGESRFAMIGGADSSGFTIWVGTASGQGVDGAQFHYMVGCLGSVSGMSGM